eukprot:993639-Prymnesium_polylepis.1
MAHAAQKPWTQRVMASAAHEHASERDARMGSSHAPLSPKASEVPVNSSRWATPKTNRVASSTRVYMSASHDQLASQ